MTTVTIEDVAESAGVGVATVDRVIHGRGKPRAGTVAKVKQAIKELGYRPNLAASALARGKTRHIGMVIPDWEIEFLNDLTRQTEALEGELEIAGASLHILRCDETNPAIYAQRFEDFANGMDACAVLAPNDPAVVEAIARLEGQGIRIATIVSEVSASIRSLFVGPNNRDLGATAATLLAPTLEHSDGVVAVIKPTALQEDHEARFLGFCNTLQMAGIEQSRIKTLVTNVNDTQEEILAQASEQLGAEPLIGVYMTGGGLGSRMDALQAYQTRKPITVATDLTALSRKLLLSQELNFVVANDVQDMIRTAFMALLRKLSEPLWEPKNQFQPVQIFTRFNLPQQT
jgi:LacI family transcriptional regulator